MRALKLLLVEDSADERDVCKSAIQLYRSQKERDIRLVEASTSEEARMALSQNRDFDGAIVDIRLAAEADAGNEVAEEMSKGFLRVPTIVLTGTPDAVNRNHSHVGIFKKGEVTYLELFDRIWDICQVGLSRILGGRGLIEQGLFRIFRDTILPQLPSWTTYGQEDAQAAERGLLRQTLSHLLHSLEEETDLFYPEEAYISPPIDENFRTGCIIMIPAEPHHHVVLNPSCDLVIRNGGKPKTSRILVAEIENDDGITQTERMVKSRSAKLIKKIKECAHHNDNSECYKHIADVQSQNLQMALSRYYSNNHAPYLHWLPKTSFFAGGFINFRHIHTLKETNASEAGVQIIAQLSPPFVKDMVSRFSSYYARQGQPDLRHPIAQPLTF